MRERRVGRGALPARIVAGAAGAAVLVTAAPPVYAQEEGGGEVVCEIHDPRVAAATGLVEASDGDGWWVLPDVEGQTDDILTIRRVGSDCAVRDTEAGSLAVEWLPKDPQDIAIEPDKGFLWIADIGDTGDRESISLTQVAVDDASDFTMTRYVYPDGMKDAEAYFLLPDRTPVFIPSTEGTAELYKSDGPGQEENTPLELAGTVTLPDGAGAVTGAALNADASKVVLRTSDTAYEWDVADGDPVASMTAAEPRATPLGEAEGGGGTDIAYDSEGNFLTIVQTGDDASPAVIHRFTPAAPAAEEPAASENAAGGGAEEGPSMVDRILDLGVGTIVKILAAIAILGMATMVFGIIIIRKYRKQNGDDGDEDDDAELGFAREESGFGKDRGAAFDDDPVDLGLDAGQPDPDLGQIARGGVYGGARPEPSGNVYGASPARSDNVYGASPARPEPTGSVYGGSRPEPSGNVYGARPATPPAGQGAVYGAAAREEPQYGAFERGGQGSVYDNAGPGQSFGARPEPSGNVYGARPAAPPPRQGNAYGAPQGSVYGAGNDERTPEPEDGFWGPPESGTTYGRGR
ncbi:hypothetical protein [Glycomyces tritici]|uniref:Uncharacterized protein n=1 Tax=Glycomyces tritici TaxID=2665176 RepID=A0ABT7YMG1_9ACTN|nr:hypothetical protein [Glycomyces tritici]MDN3239830.1 hypothetical protein [Glycomyces tritici]